MGKVGEALLPLSGLDGSLLENLEAKRLYVVAVLSIFGGTGRHSAGIELLADEM